ncbi:MAG: cytochrome c oxidase subunit III [Haliea sp.]|jgi:cytochrome c oxidase subunit 3|nr:cytochrome c oxidase subunit III [Haliea sp.]
MSIFSTLREKPWIQHPLPAGGSVDEEVADPQAAARLALRFVLAIVGVLFFLFIITFLSRSQYPDFEALSGAPWQPFTDASRLWFNTGVLAVASLAMQISLVSARRQRLNAAVVGLSAAVFFTIGFLLAQYELWLHLQSMGFYMNSNPANSYFYLLTAVHGLHLVGGLLVLAHVVFRIWYDEELATLAGPLQLCAVYWHFLFGVWLVLFALLTSTPETINALAALCGF